MNLERFHRTSVHFLRFDLQFSNREKLSRINTHFHCNSVNLMKITFTKIVKYNTTQHRLGKYNVRYNLDDTIGHFD